MPSRRFNLTSMRKPASIVHLDVYNINVLCVSDLGQRVDSLLQYCLLIFGRTVSFSEGRRFDVIQTVSA